MINGISAVNNHNYNYVTDSLHKTIEKEESKIEEGAAASYEKTEVQPPVTYTKESLVSMKNSYVKDTATAMMWQENDKRTEALSSIVQNLIGDKQNINELDPKEFWAKFKDPNLKVDEATKSQAQKDIADDGYYGVENTAKRLFDFGKTLAGDDPDKMKEMQESIQKSFGIAESYWGGTLPDISYQTLGRVNAMFDNYYKEMGIA